MGKSTQPRVKGNMKPASSSRAAELGGSASPLSFDNLGGFAQFAGNTATLHHSRPSTPSSADEVQVDLEPELVVIVKKVSKRDAVTKIKALEELEAYLKSNQDSIKPILPKWVTMYGKLVLEVDRRVRLAANQVHTLVTANAKKRLAPLLKEFIGPWLLSMYDQSKDICKVGRGSFESVFAQDKRVGVISFCQKDILDYVTDLLLYKTAETLSDARYVSKEDMIAKYARIVSSCLQIISYLIGTLSLEERAKCQSEYNIIVDDTTMWKKFATSSNPLIRKALYSFIKTLLLQWKDMVESRLDVICLSFFPAVFTEKEASTHADMWDSFLLMTKKFPESWIIIGKKKPSLPKLYHFLRSGLNGSPSIAYPSMLALLANLPDEIKNTPKFYEDVFENFWKGLSTEYIDRSNSHIFLNAYAECVVYFAITLSKTEDEQSKQIATKLIQNTFWDIIKNYFFNPRDGAVGEKLDTNGYAIIAKHLVVMASVESVKDCMAAFWSQVDEVLVQVVIDCSSVMSRTPLDMDIFCQKTGNLLQAISGELELNEKFQSIAEFTDDLAKRLLLASLGSSIVHKEKSSGLLILAGQLLSNYTKAIVHAENGVQSARQTLTLMVDGPDASLGPLVSLIISLIVRLEDKQESKGLWDAFVEQLDSLGTDKALRQAKLVVLLLEQVQSEKIAFDYSSPQLDQLIVKYNLDKLNNGDDDIPRIIVENIISLSIVLHSKGLLLSDSTISQSLEGLQHHLMKFNNYQYVQKSNELSEPSAQALLTTLSALNILQKVFKDNNTTDTILGSVSTLSSEVFDVMFVKSLIDVQEEESIRLLDDISKSSSGVWDAVVKNILLKIKDQDKLVEMVHPLFKRVRQSILDVSYTASPSDSVSRVKKLLDSIPNKDAYSLLLGDQKDWCKLSAPFHQYTDDYLALGMSDTYAAISLEPILDDDELMPVAYDLYGLSAYGRFTLFLGELLAIDSGARHKVMGGDHDWIISRLWITAIACEQGLLLPQLCRIWNVRAAQGINAFVDHLNTIFVDWFGSLIAGITDITAWNQRLLDAIKSRMESHEDRLVSFILRLVYADKSLLALSSHLLQRLFQKLIVLCDWQVADLEKWLPLLKVNSDELELPVKVAFLVSIKSELGESSSYIHYQSDLASRLSAAKGLEQFDCEEANLTQFWSLLVLLNASALKTTGFSIPAQRLTYLIQAIRPFILESEHDFSSSHQEARVKAQFGQLLEHLAKSIQDVSGSHWDFFLQCCLAWVACADTTQPEELIVVYHGLSILKALQELGLEVDEIHEVLQEHLPTLGTFLLDLMTKESKVKPAKGRRVYQTLLSDLVLHIPDSTLFSSDAFHDLDVLIASPNEILQKRAYVLLQKYVANTVQDLSVRLEFTETNEEQVNAVIDETVLNRLLNPPDVSSWQNLGMEDQGLYETLGYLLSWMLMFDHFNDITFKLKQEYTSQLKDKEAISFLMPFLCKILSIGQGQSKPFDLSPWGIDEYEILDFEATNDVSYLLLASHVYYRALTLVPSLVRLWWIDCKQRQMTIGVESYTEKHFSQILISNELELVNRPDIKSQLQENDENEFTVKTLKAASEVTATYRVDEQNMQIAIKLPSNFPLRQIDVEGIQKVGVNDKQWRGWMFAVAAVIGSQNGNIVDALTVFKRNVNLHFSGVEDCTICYSIISIQDRSIPTKQCRTCKNKFHSSCLYKWFKSSNSASCPLCRTVF
ncbi:hypothetical protein K501DRAFT_227764 [Backusella circina FSU 941]|nr:hypothetical protein K501DRAFT_227764 [Backusella circina FSU 941]